VLYAASADHLCGCVLFGFSNIKLSALLYLKIYFTLIFDGLLAVSSVSNKVIFGQLFCSANVCYSVYVAQFPEYTLPLIDHLLELKIGHWDM